MENKEIKLNIQLTEKDLLKFQYTQAPFFKNKRWMIYLGIILALYGYLFIPYIFESGFSGLDLLTFVPILIVPAAILFFSDRVEGQD